MFKSMVDRLKPVHVVLFCFILYSWISIVKTPAHILLDDEVFYFFQAKAMARGEFILFDKTNPYLFPLLLSVFSELPLMFLRFLPAFFMSLAMGIYFHLLQKHVSRITAFFATFILILHYRVIEYGVQLYTEGLLLVFLFLVFDKTLDILDEKSSWKNFILLGVYMGLSLEVKPMIPLVPFFFVIWILWRSRGQYKIKLIGATMISVTLYAPYYLFNSVTYFKDKLNFVFNFDEIINRAFLFTDQVGVVFTVILMMAIINFFKGASLKQKEIFRGIVSFTILYILFVIFALKYVFSRYFLLCLPAGALLIAECVLYESYQDRKRSRIVAAYFILFLFFLLSYVRWIPEYDKNIHVLPGYVGRHMALEDARQIYTHSRVFFLPNYKPDMVRAIPIVNNDGGRRLKLPVFDQSNHTIAKYEFCFYVPTPSYRYIFFSHVCDRMKVELDGKILSEDWDASAFVPYQINLAQPLSIGLHRLTLYIMNENNIGGIGQVFLLEKDISKILELASIIRNE
jgi:hypothetical protein